MKREKPKVMISKRAIAVKMLLDSFFINDIQIVYYSIRRFKVLSMRKLLIFILLIFGVGLVYWWLSGAPGDSGSKKSRGTVFQNPTTAPNIIGPKAPPTE